MKLQYRFLLIALLILQAGASSKLFAQNEKPHSNSNGEVIITEHALSKDAIFKSDSVVTYDIDLQNTYNTRQEGTLSYIIKTPHGGMVAQNTMPVSLEVQDSRTLHVEIPAQKTGFYKVNFMLNLTDYDDTVRRVFGVGINNVRSTHPRPVDFKLFWSNTKAQLARIPSDFKVTAKPELSKGDYNVYLVEMQSLGNITVRGWMTLPKDRLPNEKLPVYLVLPGYGATLSPILGVPHFACLALNVRGLGNSRDIINPSRDEFITYNIHDKNKYILRGAIMDCERMLDYISSNPDLDAKSIFVTGGSMGAYLSLVLAGLDSRVTLVAADNPTFSDFRWTVGIDAFPMSNIQRFARLKSLKMAQVLNTLDYFDLKNFMPAVKAKVIMAMGLLDNFAPPNTELAAYNNIPGEKKLFIYPNLGHEIDPSLGNIKGKWLYDNFHMYARIMALDGKTTDANTLADQDEDNTEKFETDPVGIMAHAGATNSIFKKNSTISYNIDLKNNLPTEQDGTLSCEVTTKDGEHVSVTTAAVKLPVQATQQIHMNLPLQNGGYYKAAFILNLSTYKDTLNRAFGVDVNNIGEFETIGMVEHAGTKDAMFSSKNTIFYTIDLKNNFGTQQDAMLACEIRTKSGKFLSLTSLAVKLEPNTTSPVHINLPSQKRGQYQADFMIHADQYDDTLRRMFSVDTMGVQSDSNPNSSEDETVNITEHPGTKNATFKSSNALYYNIDLKNNYSVQQSGKLSCQITTIDGKVLSLTSLAVSLPGKASKQVRMNMPQQKSGFYKVNFIINTDDYDDTVRRVFGVDISSIHSTHPKPANFEEFWSTAKKELAAIEPHFKMIEKPEFSRGNDQVYLIEMQSIGNITVRGWLTLPKDRKNNQKFPVYLALPGYGADLKPFHDMPDFAAIALNIRGLGNSNDVLDVSREEFLTYNILDKNKYILRGGIMDCIRAVDFIFSRPEFDSKSIYSSGGSMGGYLSLILASLDKRVTVCTAGNPAFGDFRSLVDHNDFPMGAIQRYAKENALSLDKILDNLDYFDLKNFVDGIKCKTLIGIGLLDNLAPPATELAVYNNIQSNKKIFIFPNLGHEVGNEFGSFTGRWVYDSFGIF
jgi:cephalosporin-C deacetylase-like acetyl esterase/glutamate formiminotransferase